MAKLSRAITEIDPDPDVAVSKANKWIKDQKGFVLAPDFCNVEYSDGFWYVTVLVRNDNTTKQILNHTTELGKWKFGVNLFPNAFAQAVLGSGDVMHYFGGEKY